MINVPAPHADDPDRIERIKAFVKNKDCAIDKEYLARVEAEVKKAKRAQKEQ